MSKETNYSPEIAGIEQSIKQVIPQTFFDQAAQIVPNHRPADMPEDFDVYMELSQKDHQILNRARGRRKTIAEMRQKYIGDQIAYQEIDKYDFSSAYGILALAVTSAYNRGDTKKFTELSQKLKNFNNWTKA